MRAARFAFATAFVFIAGTLSAASCANSGPVEGGGSGGTGNGTGNHGTGNSGTGNNTTSGTGNSGTGGDIPTAICLLHNCSTDAECGACSDGKTKCLVDEHRCVACNTGSAGGCPSGQTCSSWGNCAPATATCPTDKGVPTITCSKDADCAACDPRHQVCDTTVKKCVACTSGNTTQCQSTETCGGGDCVPKCPATCNADADCAKCGTAQSPAHTCNNHKCGSCTQTTTCDGQRTCDTTHGTCTKTCGQAGAPKGTCTTDDDCKGCDGSATKCNIPIGGNTGQCGQAAAGCSDLGNGVAVLPAPFDKVTNLCSNDTDCANISADFDVGQMLKDLTGWDQIHSATLSYPMHACASTTITDGKSCGVCVPCKTDSDCQNIDIDKFAGQMFGPLGAIASAFLLDQIFGDGKHEVHMYCETIAGDYGACVPCPGILTACNTSEPTPDPCHDVCTTGDAMDPLTCSDACVAKVIALDPYCAVGRWDNLCVYEVLEACNKVCESCSESGKGGHDKCVTGGPLDATCSGCVEQMCFPGSAHESCCAQGGQWTQDCIDAIPQVCTQSAYWCPNQCFSAEDCPSGQGCLLYAHDGQQGSTCGPCAGSGECRTGQNEVCNNGTCGPQ